MSGSLFLGSISCLAFAGAIVLQGRRRLNIDDALLAERISELQLSASKEVEFKNASSAKKESFISRLRLGERFVKDLSEFIHYDPLLPLGVMRTWKVLSAVTGFFAFLLAYSLAGLFYHKFFILTTLIFWPIMVRFYVKKMEEKQALLLFNQFPDALGILVRSLRVGVPLSQAIDYVAESVSEPTASRFREIAGRLSIGATMHEALDHLLKRSPSQEYRFFAVALRMQAKTGGNIIGTLSNLSDTMRLRFKAKSRARVLVAEPKMNMSILCSLPIIILLAIGAINPGYVAPIFKTTVGHHALIFAIGMWTTGLLSMFTIIKKFSP